MTINDRSFERQQREFTLTAGGTETWNVRLALRQESSTVVVSATTIPIEADKSPFPVDVISHEDISDRQELWLAPMLMTSGGINVAQEGAYGGITTMFLDGGNSNFTKVLVDGSPINPPGGAADFSILTTDNLDKLEIVHGAESAIYGTDAVDGVVQLFTHRGTTRIPSFSAFAEGGSFSSGRGGVQSSGLLDRFDYSLAWSYLDEGGQVPNNNLINRTLSGNFGYAFSDSNQLRLSLRNNSSDAGIPGQTVYEPPSLYQQINQELFSTRVQEHEPVFNPRPEHGSCRDQHDPFIPVRRQPDRCAGPHFEQKFS